MPPQPQPTSSSRSPGCSRSFSNTSRYLFSCASSSVASACGIDRAGVGHRRAEHPLVERVRDVVVVVDGLGVASLAVHAGRPRPGATAAGVSCGGGAIGIRCSMPIERTTLASTRADGRLNSHPVGQRPEQLVRIAGMDAVGLQVARNVGAGHAELAGRRGQIGGAAGCAADPGPARRRRVRRCCRRTR